MARHFIDTNVWVYAVDESDPVKRERARDVLGSVEQPVVSAQVLNEFYVVATRKIERPLTASQAATATARMAELLVVPVDRHLVLDAIALSQTHDLSLWDAAIIGAARSSSCVEVISEDLQHGREIDGVRVHNPFA